MTLKQSMMLLGAAIVLVVVCGCAPGGAIRSRPQPTATPEQALATGYLDSSGGVVEFLRVVSDAGGKVSGIWYDAYSRDGSVISLQGTFSGTIDGAHLVLTFAGPGADTDTATLTDGGNVLTIEALNTSGQVVDNVYHSATIDDYNAAVAKL